MTVRTKKDSYLKRFIINDQKTPFRVVVPAKPLEVLLNNQGEMLAHDIRAN